MNPKTITPKPTIIAPDETLETMVEQIRQRLMWHCGLDEDALTWAVVDGGERYLNGRLQQERDYKKVLGDKGFWHWYKQVYFKNCRWLMDSNGWQDLDEHISNDRYWQLAGRKDFAELDKYVRAKSDCYGFEPVLRAIYNHQEYDGRVLW